MKDREFTLPIFLGQCPRSLQGVAGAWIGLAPVLFLGRTICRQLGIA